MPGFFSATGGYAHTLQFKGDPDTFAREIHRAGCGGTICTGSTVETRIRFPAEVGASQGGVPTPDREAFPRLGKSHDGVDDKCSMPHSRQPAPVRG
jgi:hypothetical protein